MSDNDRQAAQVEFAERLQLKWLKRMEQMLDSGEITSTDMATLARVLMANGWSIDPAKLPESLKDKLTRRVSFDDELEEERGLRAV